MQECHRKPVPASLNAFPIPNVAGPLGFQFYISTIITPVAMPTLSVYNRVKAYKYDTNYELSPKLPVDDFGDWNKDTKTWANGKTHKSILMLKDSNNQFDYWDIEPEVNYSMFRLNLDLRLGIVYNWRNYFIGAQAQYNNFNYKSDHCKVNIFDAHAHLSFGVRL